MDKITKFLLKLTTKQQKSLIEILEKIQAWNLENLDIKALSGEKNMFRIRKGKFRIIIVKNWSWYSVIDINFRGNIYK